MKKLNNKSGFTLIEIIVVLIIVGVLAAIALPNLFANVQKSRGGEALAAMGSFKSNLEGCLQAHPGKENTVGNCNAIPIVNTANFSYAIAGVADNLPANVTITATNSATNPGAGTLTLTRSPAGAYTCSATGVYNGIC